MAEITICKLNNSYGYLLTDNHKLFKELWEALSFWVPGYMFMPQYKAGWFDGKIKLMDFNTRQFPLGLAEHIFELCKAKKVSCDVENAVLECFTSSTPADDIIDFISSKRVFSKMQEITPTEYQVEAVVRAIQRKRCVNICPTSFGKSLAITLECIYWINSGKRCLIVVPTKDLVDQFASDIRDYATNEQGRLEEWFPTIQKIYSGKKKELDTKTDICISTWQSLAKIEDAEGYMNQFDVIVIDEAHKSCAKKLTELMNAATTVEIRTGWTGTLSDETIGELQVKGSFGPIKQIVTTKELMDKGIVAQLSIAIARIVYPTEIAQELVSLDYNKQTSYLETLARRTKLLLQIVATQKKTGLMLYRHISHGEAIFEKARAAFPERNVYLIHGGHFQMNDKMFKSLEEMKPLIEREENGIIIANYQVVGTGISIKNLHWMMFAAPTKSFITTVQGIGRILRVSKVKHKAILIDIVDDFSAKKAGDKRITQNYAVRHFAERFDIYNSSQFDYKIINLDLYPKDQMFQG